MFLQWFALSLQIARWRLLDLVRGLRWRWCRRLASQRLVWRLHSQSREESPTRSAGRCPQANVELLNGNGVAIARAATDQAGQFNLAPAKAGTYSLKASKAGFKPAYKIVRVPAQSCRGRSQLSLEAEAGVKGSRSEPV